jgi:hypothetical protein
MLSAIPPRLRLVLLAVLAWLGWAVWPAFNPTAEVARRQTEFLEALSTADTSTIADLASDHYRDVWDYDREKLVLAIGDLGPALAGLAIVAEENAPVREGATATVTTRLQALGNPLGPGASFVQSQLQRAREPVVFHWQKESLWPRSWRLVRIEHPTLQPPAGYSPGQGMTW